MIILENGFKIKADESNFTLIKCKTIVKDDGEKEIESTVGYFATLVQALERYLREIERQVIQFDTMDIKQAITMLKLAHKGIINEIQTLGGKI